MVLGNGWRRLLVSDERNGGKLADPTRLPPSESSLYHTALANCADHWGLVLDKTEPIRDGITHVFGTEVDGGTPFIIQISDGAVRSCGELQGELRWLDHLIRHGCRITTPIPPLRGEFLKTIDVEKSTMHVCCFERFGGRQLDPATDAEWNDDLFLNFGRQIGRIHRVSEASF